MRVLRASTSCETSLMILAFSRGDNVVNHLANRCGSRGVSESVGGEGGGNGGAYHFALPRQQDEVSGTCQSPSSCGSGGRGGLST